MHRAVGIEAFRVFAHDDDIEFLAAWRRKGRPCPGRADIAVEIERLAQYAGGVDAAFRGRRIGIVRDRPEDHALAVAGRLERFRRHGRAMRLKSGKADRHAVEGEIKAKLPVRLPENRKGGPDDFRPYAVAFHHENVHAHIRGHALVSPPFITAPCSSTIAFWMSKMQFYGPCRQSKP